MRLIIRLWDWFVRILWRLMIAPPLTVYRCLAGFVAGRWRRMRRFLGRRVVVNTIAVLVLAVAAAAAIASIQARALGIGPVNPQLGMYMLLVVLGGAVGYVMVDRQSGDDLFSEHIRDHLWQRARPDADHLERISLKPDRTFAGFGDQFAAIPGNADEILLLLLQTKESADIDDKYSTEKIIIQVSALEERDDRKRVKWACFVSRSGRFAAFQSYAAFRHQVLVKRNTRYAEILNRTSEADFTAALEAERALGDRYQIVDGAGQVRPASIADAIGALDLLSIPDGELQLRALRALIAAGRAQAMLISQGDYKPLGVLTLQGIVHDILGKSFGFLEGRR